MKNTVLAIVSVFTFNTACVTLVDDGSVEACVIVCDHTEEGKVTLKSVVTDANNVDCKACNNLLLFAASEFACGEGAEVSADEFCAESGVK